MRSDVLKAIGAFLVPSLVLITVFALCGLTAVGYQLLAYAAGVAGLVYVIAHMDIGANR